MSEGGGVSGPGDRPLKVAGRVASAILVATAVVLALIGGNGGESSAAGSPAHLVSVAGLTELEGALGHSIYWAGERSTARLELREEAEGSVYLRYLPSGVEAGDPAQRYLTVGTYPVVGAAGVLRRLAAKAGVSVQHLPDGAVVLPNPSLRGSVYLAYPGSDLQVEVYDPLPGTALGLVRSGAIRPVR